MAKKRNRITAAMSQTIAESSPLIKKTKKTVLENIDENNILEIPLTRLQKNPYQPRIDINLHSLNELISSIEQNGLMQPIVITNKQEDGMHTIVAGHRRFEAFKIMGKNTIPALVMIDLEDKDLAILSLTENLMRENLHPIENAIAIKNILDIGLVESQNKLAEYVGLSKGYISKLMNILKLPSSIINIIKEDNYKDINILVLINKLKDAEEMSEAYNLIKNMTRSEAEKYIKSKYFQHQKTQESLLSVKKSNTKISINLNIKELTKDQIKQINEEIENLNTKITSLSQLWEN